MREVSLELIDDFCIPYEREGVVINSHVDAELEIEPVLVSDGRQISTLSPDIEMSPAENIS